MNLSDFQAKLQKLDEQIVAVLEAFYADTGVMVANAFVEIDVASKSYVITTGLDFLEPKEEV